MTLDLKDLLALAFERSAAVRTLWSSYVVVASAVIGVHVSPTPQGTVLPIVPWLGASWCKVILCLGVKSWGQVILLVVFGAFAIWNYQHIKIVEHQRSLLRSLLPENAPSRPEWMEVLQPAGKRLLLGFHLLFDLAVVLVVVLYPSTGGQ